MLRLQLAARSGAPAPAAASRAPRPAARNAPLAQLRALRAGGVTAEPVLQRALVEQLLSRAMGSALLNEAPFQAMVDEVLDTLRADEELALLLRRAIETPPEETAP